MQRFEDHFYIKKLLGFGGKQNDHGSLILNFTLKVRVLIDLNSFTHVVYTR